VEEAFVGTRLSLRDRLNRLLGGRGRPDSTVHVYIEFPTEDRATRASWKLQRHVNYTIQPTATGSWRLVIDYDAWSEDGYPHSDHFKATAGFMRGKYIGNSRDDAGLP